MVSDSFNYSTKGPIYTSSLDPEPEAINIESVLYDESQMYITWLESPDSDFLKYEIYFGENDTLNVSLLDSIFDKSLTTFSINEFDPHLKNYFRIIVYDTLNQNTNGAFNSNETQPIPEPVILDSISSFGNELTINWSAYSNLDFQQYAANYDGEVIPGQYQNIKDVDDYNRIRGVNIVSTQLNPQQYYPNPTEEDYINGFFIRYFACKRNETKYLELDKNTYEKMKKNNTTYNYIPYVVTEVQWTLVGEARDVSQANLNIIESTERKINKKGLKEFINNDFSKFYKPQSIQSNLITDGTVYKNSRTGLAYSGSYHIHPDKGPMIGAEHIKEYHDYLVPIS